MGGVFIGLDIGGTKTEALAVNSSAGSRGRAVASTITTHPDAMLGGVVDTVYQALQNANLSGSQIAGIGVGVPGLVTRETGVVQHAVNLRLESYPLGAELSARLNAPVYLENDVRIAALGAFDYVSTHEAISSLAYLGIGTGVASGIVLDGKLYRGANGMAGEVGHIIIEEQGVVCNCGLRGCLETVLSGPGIARQAAAAGLPERMTTTDLFLLASEGSTDAQGVIDHISHVLARAVQWIVMMYDVEKVVLGGGVTNVGTALLDAVRAEISQMHNQSDLARILLPTDKVMLLPIDFNPGISGAIRMAREAVSTEAI